MLEPEQVLSHAVEDDLICRKQLQRLFVTLEKVLNAAHRVQLLSPLEESEPEGLLGKRWKSCSFLCFVPEQWKQMTVCVGNLYNVFQRGQSIKHQLPLPGP